VIERTKDPEFYELKIYIIGELFDLMKYQHLDDFLNHIETLLRGDKNVFIYNTNPIKLAMVIIDILHKIKSKFNISVFRTNILKHEIEELTKKVIRNISDSEELKQLLK